jgi:transcriptional antiterminator RfaH
MPLLPLEPFLHPEDLLSRTPGNGLGWWVLHTKPRTEKSLARHLHARGLGFFLPLFQRRFRSGGKARTSFLPLFPGYLFLHGDGQARLLALETNLVVNVLPVPDQPQLQKDLARVHQLIISEAALAPEDKLQPGTPVEVVDGPLRGLKGTVLRRGKKLKFFVEVSLLQRGVSAEVESWMIQPIEKG